MTVILTKRRSGANRVLVKTATLLPFAAMLAACGGCVQVQAPDKPIEINLNVNIRQEVVLSLKQDAAELINDNAELFPK